MVGGAWLAGVCGDRYGRRFAYQVNLLVFGLASLAGAMAPSMSWLVAARFVMGLGLGAEIVVGYVTISEFVPPMSRGLWGGALAVITNSALFVSALVGRVIIPNYGWRWMFVIVGVGALFVWFLRRSMPESPRWLEARGRDADAEAVMAAIDHQVAPNGGLPAPAIVAVAASPPGSEWRLFAPGMLMRIVIGSVMLIALNTAVYGFIAFLPTFMVKQGMSIVASLNYTTLMMFGGPVGALIGLWLVDRVGREPCVVGFSLLAVVFGALYPLAGNPTLVTLLGFLLITAVYVLVAIGWALYLPELFPTEIRMRGAGATPPGPSALERGGIAIVPNTIGYSTLGGSPDALRRIFTAKGRQASKRNALVANAAWHRDLHVCTPRGREIVAAVTGDYDLPLGCIAPYRTDHPAIVATDPDAVRDSSSGGTIAMLLNAGPFHAALTALNHRARRLLFGSSVNLTLSGTRLCVEEIQPEILPLADVVIDHGLQRYHCYAASSTLLNVETLEIVRHGSCFADIA